MFQHERSLVQKHAGKPFVLLGVNGDQDREQLRKDIEKHQLTWRSWWDGMGGPIARNWEIAGWPTTYVLDAKGIIREKNLRYDDLDRAVEELLKEVQ
jgi:hypothetical protein